ncbi:MAG: hypothetical protein HQ518_18120, partial [Rhodopirellula sp.]|nr:hypothetical protein [Rhodopirellula sp.]
MNGKSVSLPSVFQSPAEMQEAQQKLQDLAACLSAVIRGKQEAVEVLITAILAGGSVLMDDVPGVGKTTL